MHDIGSYIALRVNDHIHSNYTPKAGLYETRVRRLRTAGDLLGVTAVALAAIATAYLFGELAVWVPVVTTIGTSVTAYIAAARYDHLVIEYLRAAQRLEHLLREHLDNPASDTATFVDACESAISVENQGWMALWDIPNQIVDFARTPG